MNARRIALLVAALGSFPAAMACTKNKTDSETSGSAASSGATTSGRQGTRPVVELVTTLGNIQVELRPDKAPRTVENFLGYVRSGHYAGTIFHRVIDGFMIQGGGFDPAFSEKPTRPPVQNEADNGLTNDRGTVAMARTSEPHSASAQFFVNVADNSGLNHTAKTLEGWGYTVFGRLISGMDVVDKIRAVPTGPKGPFEKDVPQEDVVLKEARIVSE